jgi:hypothetical protein
MYSRLYTTQTPIVTAAAARILPASITPAPEPAASGFRGVTQALRRTRFPHSTGLVRRLLGSLRGIGGRTLRSLFPRGIGGCRLQESPVHSPNHGLRQARSTVQTLFSQTNHALIIPVLRQIVRLRNRWLKFLPLPHPRRSNPPITCASL